MTVDCVTVSELAPEERFDYFWRQPGEWVEAPNRRRGGESGVQRVKGAQGRLLYSKRQTGHIYRSLLHPFGRPTVLRELEAMKALRMLNVRVPELVFCEARRDTAKAWRALLVTAALDGFEDVDSWYAGGGRERHGEALHERMLKDLASVLVRMHKGRWQHGCLYSKHIFIKVTGQAESTRVEIALLDFEKSRQRLSAKRAALHDMTQLRRHSSWDARDWQKLSYFYETAFGSAIKGLE